jgi:flagellar biosynthesis/type III secretory pathway chaperone
MSTQLDDLIATTERLTLMVQTETENLLQKRPTELSDDISDKQLLAQAYTQLVGTMKPLKLSLTTAPDAQRAKLRTVLAALDAALLRNGDILMQLQNRSRNLLEAIAQEINPSSKPAFAYTAHGQSKTQRSNGSIALNAVI